MELAKAGAMTSNSTTDANHRILVVDDEPSLTLAFEATFMAEGFDVNTACDGEQALATLERDGYGETYDAVTLDLRMPGVDGLEVMERLHKAGKRLPILLTSAHMDTATAVRAACFGVVDFLKKPSTPGELRSAVYQMIEDHNPDVEMEQGTIRHAKQKIRNGQYSEALEILKNINRDGNEKSLGPWTAIVSHLIAITENGTRPPEFASDNFYDAADLLDQLSLNRT